MGKLKKKTKNKNHASSTEFKEIEFKYDASGIDVKSFLEKVKSMKPVSKKMAAGWDYYFSKGNEFIRFRDDHKRPELTIKRRLNKNSSAHRIELNVPLKEGNNLHSVRKMTELLGYKENFSIFKKCHIFFFKEVDVVFYTVFDERNRQVGQFIEIEFLESVKGKKVSYALTKIKQYEKMLASIGVSSSQRINKTLWEMFKRN